MPSLICMLVPLNFEEQRVDSERLRVKCNALIAKHDYRIRAYKLDKQLGFGDFKKSCR